jgi:NADPH2:quinone reductase
MTMTSDKHYRALVVEQLSPDFSGVALRTLAVTLPSSQQVLVRVRAAALNFPDVLLTQGKYQFTPALPFVPGLEASGEVVAVGPGVEHVRPGDAVVAQTRQGGAIGEMMIADAVEVRPMPANLDWNEAAAYSAVGMTAYVSLVHRGQLLAGETLVVHGASGGTGLATVRLGRHLGARVIATGRSAEKLETALAAGAHEIIQVGDGLRDDILRLTDGKGADVVFDTIGGDVFDASLRSLAWGGRLLVVGFLGGRIADLKSNYVLIKNVSIIGIRAGEFIRRNPAQGALVMREVDALAAQGVLAPHVSARFALADAVQALRLLASGKATGKIVVTME